MKLLCHQEAKAFKSNGPSQLPEADGNTVPVCFWDLAPLVKDKKSTWQKSCRESLKREQEAPTLEEEMKTQGSVAESNRVVLVQGLKRLKKLRGEEEEAKELLGNVRERKNNKKMKCGLNSKVT